MEIDNSSSYMLASSPPSAPEASGNTWLCIGAQAFNQNNVSKEDFQRQLQLAEYKNKYNEYLSGTQYQRAVAEIKKHALNPILPYSKGGSPDSATHGSAPAGSGASGKGDDLVLQMMAGLVSKAMSGIADAISPRRRASKTLSQIKEIGSAASSFAPLLSLL